MQISEIPDQPGYFVDSDGNVYSQWVNRGQHGTVKGSMLHKLTTSKGKNGYLSIRFRKGGRVELVHRLIYRVFHGPIPDGKFICHKDGNRLNNSASNLYAGTQVENMGDMVRHGKSALSKLSEKEIQEILRLRGTMMVKDIAYKYNVTRQTVTSILRGKTWTYMTNEGAKRA